MDVGTYSQACESSPLGPLRLEKHGRQCLTEENIADLQTKFGSKAVTPTNSSQRVALETSNEAFAQRPRAKCQLRQQRSIDECFDTEIRLPQECRSRCTDLFFASVSPDDSRAGGALGHTTDSVRHPGRTAVCGSPDALRTILL